MDLAVANVTDNSLSILLGRGDGTFHRVDVPTGGVGPASLALGDFNRDGQLDLAVVEYLSDEVTIMLGNGDGTFSFAGELFPLDTVNSVTTADLNGDGNLDLAVSVQGYQAIYLGNGDGTFQDAGKAGASNLETTTVADLNGDGVPDLVILSGYFGGSTNLLVSQGDGSGAFASPYSTSAGSWPNTLPQRPTIGDFNGDGKLDVGASDGVHALVLLQSAMTLSPASLHFGSKKIGKKSSPRASILTNAGSTPVSISGFVVHGTNKEDFSQTNDCPPTLASGQHCTIQVTFKPSKAGRERATVQVSDNAIPGHQKLSVHGLGTY